MMAHLPALTHVEVGHLELQDSHADGQMACIWEELHIYSRICATSLARLPLRCIKRLGVGQVDCYNGADPAAASTQPTVLLKAALAAAPDCCCSVTWRGRLSLFCPVRKMPAMLPLLARWEGVKSMLVETKAAEPEYLTPAAVGALGALLESMPNCSELALHNVAPSLNASLLPALSRTSVLTLDFTELHMTEAQLMLWCAGRPEGRRMIVRVKPDYVDGSVDNVRAAIHGSGSAVQLVIDVGFSTLSE
jgi:hypothetical protein